MNRILIASLTALALACASKPQDATSPESSAPIYTAEAGTNPVGVIPAGMLRDTVRNKTLDLSIDYPTTKGPHPMVIFSHGLGSAPRDYTGMASYWASYGYVVVRPAHADA